MLSRRSVANPSEFVYHIRLDPEGVTLEELVRVAGTGRAVKERSEEAKGDVGLDQYQVRPWDGW